MLPPPLPEQIITNEDEEKSTILDVASQNNRHVVTDEKYIFSPQYRYDTTYAVALTTTRNRLLKKYVHFELDRKHASALQRPNKSSRTRMRETRRFSTMRVRTADFNVVL
jgi:hypothetical protein